MEERARLAQLLARLDLPVPLAAQARLLQFQAEMLRWNRKVNLTAITEPAEAIEKHLVDSLTPLPFLQGDERLLDIGSGAGFPGLPLKLARPTLRLVSVDAVGKKIAFQRHIGRLFGLADFSPLAARVEALPQQKEFRAAFDLIVSRAFASLPEFARHALPLLSAGGVLLAMKGAEGEGELHGSLAELKGLGLVPQAVHSLRLPASGAARTLIFLRSE